MKLRNKSIPDLVADGYLRKGYLIGPGVTAIFSLKRRQGALLAWTFDEDDDYEAMLLVHLTDDEAKAVMATDVKVSGLLERVRATLRHRTAWLLRDEGEQQHATPFVIREEWTEEEFTDELVRAAEDPELYLRRLLAEASSPRFTEPLAAMQPQFWAPLRPPLSETDPLVAH